MHVCIVIAYIVMALYSYGLDSYGLSLQFGMHHTCIVMAYIVMLYIVMTCIVMAYNLVAYIVMACIVMDSPCRFGVRHTCARREFETLGRVLDRLIDMSRTFKSHYYIGHNYIGP